MGSFVGSWLGWEGVQGRLDKLQEIGHHLSDQLRLEYIRMAADQKNYSNTEDAWDTKKPTVVFSTSPKLKKQKGRVPNCRHGLVSELLLPGAILCSCSWVTSCND